MTITYTEAGSRLVGNEGEQRLRVLVLSRNYPNNVLKILGL